MITEERKQTLLGASRRVQTGAYAPYSKYFVGAAVLGEDGNIYCGVNIENAFYGLTVCGERSAIFKMVNGGVLRFHAIAFCGEGRGSPCGACRQVMVEFAGDVPVYLTSSKGEVRETTLYNLLPEHFGPDNLARGQSNL